MKCNNENHKNTKDCDYIDDDGNCNFAKNKCAWEKIINKTIAKVLEEDKGASK